MNVTHLEHKDCLYTMVYSKERQELSFLSKNLYYRPMTMIGILQSSYTNYHTLHCNDNHVRSFVGLKSDLHQTHVMTNKKADEKIKEK